MLLYYLSETAANPEPQQSKQWRPSRGIILLITYFATNHFLTIQPLGILIVLSSHRPCLKASMSLDPGAGVGNQMRIRSGTRVAVFTNSNIAM